MAIKFPTQKSVPEGDISKYLILIYGQPKIGKTTIAGQFPDPLFLMFEPGARSLSLYKMEVTTWKRFTRIIEKLEEDKERFRTVVIDTYARAYELCSEHVCDELGIDHPSDAGYGKGWNAVDREFQKWMNRISLSGRGVVLVCHATEKDIEQPDGKEKLMVVPDAGKQARKFLDRSVDLYCYYHYGKNGKRFLRVKGTEDIVAGNRIDGHFLGASKFSAGNSAKEAYENLMKAFRNELSDEAPVAEGKKLSFKLK